MIHCCDIYIIAGTLQWYVVVVNGNLHTNMYATNLLRSETVLPSATGMSDNVGHYLVGSFAVLARGWVSRLLLVITDTTTSIAKCTCHLSALTWQWYYSK